MGCDIHSFCEVRTKSGKWEYQKKKFKNSYHNPDRVSKIDSDGYEWNAEFIDSPFDIRSYDTFAILADVRNGYGFAGIKTGEGFNVISEPKGVPDDASEEYRQKCDGWGVDGHSHSFLSLEELKSFDWDQITMKRGVISFDNWVKLKDKIDPPSYWSGGISGLDIVTVDEDVAESIINGNNTYKGMRVYVNYHWSIRYRDHARHLLEDSIPQMEKLGSDQDVRMVFFFDN